MSVRITLIVVDRDDERLTSELRIERDDRRAALSAISDLVEMLCGVEPLLDGHTIRPVEPIAQPDTSFHDRQTPQLKPGLTCRYCLVGIKPSPATWTARRFLDANRGIYCASSIDRPHEPIDADRPGPCAFCGTQLLRHADGQYDAPGAGDGVARQVCPGRVNGRHQPYDPAEPVGDCARCGVALRSIASAGHGVDLSGGTACDLDGAPLHTLAKLSS